MQVLTDLTRRQEQCVDITQDMDSVRIALVLLKKKLDVCLRATMTVTKMRFDVLPEDTHVYNTAAHRNS